MREGWEVTTLGKACEIKPPKKEAKERLSSADFVSFVPMNDLGIRRKDFSSSEQRSLGKVLGNYTYFADGDVLLAKITPCFENGKLGIARGLSNGIGFGSSEFIVFRATKRIDPEFLFYFLSQDSFRDSGARVMSGAVGHKRVPKDFIENYPIPLPHMAEQKRIVAILDEVFAGIATAIANTEKNLTNARELFESYLDSAFTSLSEKWSYEKLENLCERITKGSSPKWQGINYVDEPGILFVTSENVGRNCMIFQRSKYVEEFFNDKDSKSILKQGDVLTNIVGASIGRTAIYDREDLANINQAVCLIRCNSKKLRNHFLSYMLNSPFFRQILHDNEINNARANLSLGFFRSLQIPLPPIGIQEATVLKLTEISSEIQRIEAIYQQKLTALTELKQSLLQKAFSGELTAEAVKEAAA